MMRKKNYLFLIYIVTLVCLSSIIASSMPLKKETNYKKNEILTTDSVKPFSINVKDSIKNELIKEAEKYIFCKFPKTNKTLPTSIVENGLEHNIDILFMMAQTQIETCFGTAGAGRETSRRSLFGVAKRKYVTYDKAIEDYIAILKKNYLANNRTEQHLMLKYTTKGGGRYAANPNYEAELRYAYSDINKKTNIKSLQLEYNNAK